MGRPSLSTARNAPDPVEHDQFEAELLRFPLSYLCDLPVATSFVLQVTGIPVEVRCISARGVTVEPERELIRGIFLDADELRAVALGVAAERLTSADFKGFCLLKLADPGFRIDEEIAMSGATASDAERAAPWALGRVLEALDLRLQAAALLAAAPSLRPSRPAPRFEPGSESAAA